MADVTPSGRDGLAGSRARRSLGEVHHGKSFTFGCLGLTAIRRDEKVRLVGESAPGVEGVERPQGMTFEAAEGLLEGVLGEVAEIGIG